MYHCTMLISILLTELLNKLKKVFHNSQVNILNIKFVLKQTNNKLLQD